MFVLHEKTPIIVIGSHTCKCPNNRMCAFVTSCTCTVAQGWTILYSIWYRCSTVSRLLIRRTINSCVWIYVAADLSVCANNYTQQHIKTDYESTKIKTTTNNKFNCIHVRNKYILNQNRIQFTVWIYKIQVSVNFCKTISERSHTLSSRKSKWLKLKPLLINYSQCCYKSTQANKTCKTRPQNFIAIQNY